MTSDRQLEAVHGGIDFDELRSLGREPASIQDFSSNILPCLPAFPVSESVLTATWDQYPDRNGIVLREAIAAKWKIQPQQIVLGNGASELIHLIARIVSKGSPSTVIVGPTFSEYGRAYDLLGAPYHEFPTSISTRFQVQLDHIKMHCDRWNVQVVWLCNPNNPTGSLVPRDQLIRWMEESPSRRFVVDESYVDFVEGVASLLPLVRENLIVIRSMTKSYAMAGLRLGFAVAPENCCRQISSIRVPWSVNAIALAAGVAAISSAKHYETAIHELRGYRDTLVQDLRHEGFEVFDSETCFFLVRVGEGASCRRFLLERGLLVRCCDSFGLSDLIRISVQRPESNKKLRDALVDWRTRSSILKASPADG